ncbi:uncharacterized protein L3040_003973 [Drepanopeziza brunnea f. sp. 'multigermtubi']|uniref:uncharacterized protein n=1 Tax=Drepanopeziza brunnea f. sp. 'multigermtubi' TaxID=698441 RepID=UPI0023A75539|nr:hypothetical protein L3040_003973 [Drepanopeziza brunnea f. sp. 'multigermtubi']
MPLNYHSENNDSATARKRRRRLREGSYRHRVCLWHRARNRSSLPRPSYLDSTNFLPKLLLLPRYYKDGVSAILPVIQYAKIDDQRDHERCHFRRGDLLPGGECDQAIRICVSKLGNQIDVLAKVAGITDTYEAIDIFTDREWDCIMPTRMIHAVLPFMRSKQRGSIINVAPRTAAAATGLAYTTSQHGLLGVTRHTALS